MKNGSSPDTLINNVLERAAAGKPVTAAALGEAITSQEVYERTIAPSAGILVLDGKGRPNLAPEKTDKDLVAVLGPDPRLLGVFFGSIIEPQLATFLAQAVVVAGFPTITLPRLISIAQWFQEGNAGRALTATDIAPFVEIVRSSAVGSRLGGLSLPTKTFEVATPALVAANGANIVPSIQNPSLGALVPIAPPAPSRSAVPSRPMTVAYVGIAFSPDEGTREYVDAVLKAVNEAFRGEVSVLDVPADERLAEKALAAHETVSERAGEHFYVNLTRSARSGAAARTSPEIARAAAERSRQIIDAVGPQVQRARRAVYDELNRRYQIANDSERTALAAVVFDAVEAEMLTPVDWDRVVAGEVAFEVRSTARGFDRNLKSVDELISAAGVLPASGVMRGDPAAFERFIATRVGDGLASLMQDIPVTNTKAMPLESLLRDGQVDPAVLQVIGQLKDRFGQLVIYYRGKDESAARTALEALEKEGYRRTVLVPILENAGSFVEQIEKAMPGQKLTVLFDDEIFNADPFTVKPDSSNKFVLVPKTVSDPKLGNRPLPPLQQLVLAMVAETKQGVLIAAGTAEIYKAEEGGALSKLLSWAKYVPLPVKIFEEIAEAIRRIRTVSVSA